MASGQSAVLTVRNQRRNSFWPTCSRNDQLSFLVENGSISSVERRYSLSRLLALDAMPKKVQSNATGVENSDDWHSCEQALPHL